MKLLKFSIFFTIFTLFLSCKEEAPALPIIEETPVVSTFYFIRHAEKDRSDSSNVDPELTQDGLGRAMRWAEIFTDVYLDKVYSTDYERTIMTASPTAIKNDISITYYAPQGIDIEQFKADNLGKNVLVVGHSNTTPGFVNKMLSEPQFEDMDDSDNGSLFIVQVVGKNSTVQRLHMN